MTRVFLVRLILLALGCAQATAAPLPPPRPSFPGDALPEARTPAAEAAPAPDTPARTGESDPPGFERAERAGLAELLRKHARRDGVPLALLHRIIMRESKYRSHLFNRRFYGLMQITPATARSMGFHGAPKDLLDAETNLRYGVPYLANAWALSDGDMNRAVRLYAAGYYDTAKSRNMLGLMRTADSPPMAPQPQATDVAAPPPPQKSFFDNFSPGSGQ